MPITESAPSGSAPAISKANLLREAAEEIAALPRRDRLRQRRLAAQRLGVAQRVLERAVARAEPAQDVLRFPDLRREIGELKLGGSSLPSAEIAIRLCGDRINSGKLSLLQAQQEIARVLATGGIKTRKCRIGTVTRWCYQKRAFRNSAGNRGSLS